MFKRCLKSFSKIEEHSSTMYMSYVCILFVQTVVISAMAISRIESSAGIVAEARIRLLLLL